MRGKSREETVYRMMLNTIEKEEKEGQENHRKKERDYAKEKNFV